MSDKPKRLYLCIKRYTYKGETFESTSITTDLKQKIVCESVVIVDVLQETMFKNTLTGLKDKETIKKYMKQNVKHLKKFYREFYDMDYEL